MSFIYSFLQKRKMHENHYGIIMVVIAYVLSVLMLILGSDIFYNIKSTAAGLKTRTEEETEDSTIDGVYQPRINDANERLMYASLVNPYNLSDIQDHSEDDTTENNLEDGNTVWFLGNAMNSDSFETLMGEMDRFVTAAEEKAAKTVVGKKPIKSQNSTAKTVSSYSVTVASSDSVVTVKKDEVKMLERIVEAEASGEDMVGKILVANVILNRMADDDFPDTVEEVIFQEVDGDYQFSPVANKRYWNVSVSKNTKEAVARALDGEDYSEGALYFIARKRTTSKSAEWFDKNLEWLFKHGGHEFFKNR